MEPEKRKFLFSIFIPLTFVIVLWLIKLVEVIFNINFSQYGLNPGNPSGLIGILTSPLIHADFTHLIANTFPILFLGTGILYFYRTASFKVFTIVYFLPGILVWLFGRSAYHIGASGLIYGFLTFLFFSGVIRRDNRSIALALIVTFLYGGLIWGVLPVDPRISWESHLYGAATGIVCAFLFRKLDPLPKYDWEEEDEDEAK